MLAGKNVSSPCAGTRVVVMEIEADHSNSYEVKTEGLCLSRTGNPCISGDRGF